MSNLKKILVNKHSCKSIWFMRQAGRYLPEFREIRSKNTNFIDLCLNSKLSSEITLQPIKRFDIDSAIIFSDILLVPYALGQNVNFSKNYGPKLDKLNIDKFLDNSEEMFSRKLEPVYKAIEITRAKLEKKKSLISFVGAPWTLIIYMFNLKESSKEINNEALNDNIKSINKILEKLTNFLCTHIKNQINAGADVVQIFDSWAGIIPKKNIDEYCYKPNAKIVDFCKKEKIPCICFPRGIMEDYEEFNKIVKPDAINLDPLINPSWAKKKLTNVVLQGGLDPKILLQKDDDMIDAATKYMYAFKDIPYVFNLGHGLLPETDPDKVKKLVNFYRNFNG